VNLSTKSSLSRAPDGNKLNHTKSQVFTHTISNQKKTKTKDRVKKKDQQTRYNVGGVSVEGMGCGCGVCNVITGESERSALYIKINGGASETDKERQRQNKDRKTYKLEKEAARTKGPIPKQFP